LIRTEKIETKTGGENDIVNMTDLVENMLAKSHAKEGFVLLFLQSTTSALTVMEFEDGLITDIPKTLGRLIPKSIEYEHERAYHDGNGHSHIKSSIVGVDLAIPFSEGHLLLGTWQQIVLMEFDVRPRNRRIIAQIISE
jgi:secondary thiamine-phosphate synthase enzyme